MTISIWNKLNFYILLSQKKWVSSSCHFFCHLLQSGLARINWIRAVYQFCVEQLICCQKCWANGCRAIAIRAVHPHSFHFRFMLISLFRHSTAIIRSSDLTVALKLGFWGGGFPLWRLCRLPTLFNSFKTPKSNLAGQAKV